MLILPAYAKINLALDVVRRRGDGLHDIDSVIVNIDWHDIVGVTLLATTHRDVSLRVSGPASSGVPHEESNLAARAARALVEHSRTPLHVSVWLDKHVPHAAGLGGGSADAAAVLRAVNRLLIADSSGVENETLQRIAAVIGSDVPALLAGSGVRVQGVGDVVARVPVPTLHMVVVTTAPSSTGAVYAATTPDDMVQSNRIDSLLASLAHGRADDTAMGSALEHAATRASPALADAIARARAATPDAVWHLTGSGGAIFSVAANRPAAESLAARMRSNGFPARACRTVSRANAF